jgi:membrane protease subunit HflK
VTRERLYLETMETVLGASNKVLLDIPDGNSLMYLPLDQIMKQQPTPQPRTSMNAMVEPTTASTGTPSPRLRDTSRERGSR